jgi:hypothetical protein
LTCFFIDGPEKFPSPALYPKTISEYLDISCQARDEWIGWDAEQRQAHLHGVVGMCRFLIRPSVQCRNLASNAECSRRPWLNEIPSIGDRSEYTQAASFIPVGKTKGRGRQDRYRESALSVKEIYVYPLMRDFRERIGLPRDAGLGALGPADGIETEHWAKNEFGDAPLGDARPSRRLVEVAAKKAEVPDRVYSGVAKGDWASVKGYYRMIDQLQGV